MTQWLTDDDAPPEFSIDKEAELRSAAHDNATVRYVRQSVGPEDVQRHVQDGKRVTRLAMTWTDRISFVVTDGFDLRKITALDVLKQPNEGFGQVGAFDGEFALTSGELSKMLRDILRAFGGEYVDAEPA